jgi:choloylglycine hydrolase
VILLSAASSVFPCTSFILKNSQNILLGHNLDWHIGTGLLIVNKKNVRKTALVDSLEKPVQWVSRYGSITFNQVGRGFPYGGMNETGLVVEQMTFDLTRYPAKDARHPVSACQWIQYQRGEGAVKNKIVDLNQIDFSCKKPSLVTERA